MPRLPLSRHALPALLVVLAALLLALLASPPSHAVVVTGAGSVSATAASVADEDLPPGDVAFPIGSDGLTKAQQVANSFWNAQPCGGQVELAWTKLDAQTNATASWKNPTDAWNNPGENFDCRIDLNPDAGFDFPKLCTVMTHEIGHLLGNQHADRPGLLMSPVYSGALQQCIDADPAPPAPASATAEVQGTVAAPAPARPRAVQASRSVRRTATRRLTLKRRAAYKRCVRRLRAAGHRGRCRRVLSATDARRAVR